MPAKCPASPRGDAGDVRQAQPEAFHLHLRETRLLDDCARSAQRIAAIGTDMTDGLKQALAHAGVGAPRRGDVLNEDERPPGLSTRRMSSRA